jgi:hypothetical protein
MSRAFTLLVAYRALQDLTESEKALRMIVESIRDCQRKAGS